MAEADEGVVGYLIGCRRYHRYRLVQGALLALSIAPRVLLRVAAGRYDARSRSFLRWCLLDAPRERPRTPARAAHFHFNFLRAYRNTGAARRMLFDFLDLMRRRGVSCVYGQMAVYENRRSSERAFQRYGFHCFDRRPFSKFQLAGGRRAYLATFVRRLDGSEPTPS